MRDLSAVRGLQPELEQAGIDVLLLNIHDPVGSALLERFGFRFTPTYLVFAVDHSEALRSNSLPTLSDIQRAVQSG